METPNVTKEFLEAALGYPVESFTLEAGSNPGDNFMSNLFSIKVTKAGKTSNEVAATAHLLLKCFPNHPARQDMLHKCNIFNKEVCVYSIWVPLLKNLASTEHEELPFAEFLAGSAIDYFKNDPKVLSEQKGAGDGGILENFLLFVDLRKSGGYRMGDRLRGLDVDHCRLVMTELARIHALSWAYKQTKNVPLLIEEFPFFEETMFNEALEADYESMTASMVAHNLSMVEKAFAPEGGVNSKEYQAAKTFFDREVMATSKLFLKVGGIDEGEIEGLLRVKPAEPLPSGPEDRAAKPWLVACHGDCWVNNFLFKYEKGKPIQMKIVDLQIIREACPTTDLAYFFYSSTTAELRSTHLESLLVLYFEEFVRHCVKHGVPTLPGFDFPTLKRKFHRAKIFGLCLSTFLLPIVLTPPEQSKNLDEEDVNKPMQEVFGDLMMADEVNSNTNLQGRLKEVVAELYNDGVI